MWKIKEKTFALEQKRQSTQMGGSCGAGTRFAWVFVCASFCECHRE